MNVYKYVFLCDDSFFHIIYVDCNGHQLIEKYYVVSDYKDYKDDDIIVVNNVVYIPYKIYVRGFLFDK